MKKMPVRFAIAFAFIIGLLMITTVGGVVANETSKSGDYASHFEMKHIGITLLENGDDVGHRDYYTEGEKGNTETYGWRVDSKPLFESITDFHVGDTYDEEFCVRNSGDIDEYVRVIIYKYWVSDDAKETKNQSLDPAMIELGLLTDDKWILDKNATTKERVILYYKNILPKGEETGLFMNTLRINDEILKDLSSTSETVKAEDGTTYTSVVYSFKYNGYKFCVEMEADAVQTHNAKDAIKSAWGRDVTIDSSTKELSLN